MKSTLLNWLFAGALVSISLTAQSVAAAPDCGAGAIDPDNDGWGWENGMSCRIVTVQPPTNTYCQLTDSDPDGDGWGWENGASCKVDPGTTVTPGNDINTAGTVQIDTTISSTLSGVTNHYYKFDITQVTGVELTTNYLTGGSIDTYITDGQRTYLEPYYGRPEACLPPGEYFLILDRWRVDTVNVIDYTVKISTLDINCAAPTNTITAKTGENLYVTDDGSVFSGSWNASYGGYVLSKLDASGNAQWSVDLDYFESLKSAPGGSVLVSSYDNIILLDSSGSEVWSTAIDNYYSQEPAVGKQSVITETDGAVISYNLSDGSQRWIFTTPDYGYVNDIIFTDDGQVMIYANGQILYLDE